MCFLRPLKQRESLALYFQALDRFVSEGEEEKP